MYKDMYPSLWYHTEYFLQLSAIFMVQLPQPYVTTGKTQAPKNWCLLSMVLEKTPESPLDSKEIKPVNFKRDQPWILIGRTDVEVATPVFCHLMGTADSLEKSLMLGKIESRRKKRASEDEMAGWHHWCNGHEPGQISGGGEGQRGLGCCSPWGPKELDLTRWLNNGTEYFHCPKNPLCSVYSFPPPS